MMTEEQMKARLKSDKGAQRRQIILMTRHVRKFTNTFFEVEESGKKLS